MKNISHEIIDAHTHFFSYHFFSALIQQKDKNADIEKSLHLIQSSRGISIPDKNVQDHTKKWLAEMDKYGISRMVTFASLPEESDAVAEAVHFSSDRLIGYSLLNPCAKNAVDFVHSVHKKGFKGLLLFPVMHGYSMSDESIVPVLQTAAIHDMVILVHFGLLSIPIRDVIGLPRPFDMRYGNPLDLQVTANRFPETIFVIPHFGCGFFRETLMLGSLCENVYVDTSSSNSWIRTQPEGKTLTDVFKKAFEIFGSRRIMFGTDSSVFPRGWRNDLFNEQLGIVNSIGLNQEDQHNFFAGTIKRILKLKES
jgi:predicted TIM-barrel fold metal-dependent hydrolase